MLSLHEVSVFLQYVPAPLQDIVLELRNIIASVAPDAVELIRWGGLSYCHEGRGGLVSAGICQIRHPRGPRSPGVHPRCLPA